MTGRRARSRQEGSFLELVKAQLQELQCDMSLLKASMGQLCTKQDHCFNMYTSAYAQPATTDYWCDWGAWEPLDAERLISDLVPECINNSARSGGASAKHSLLDVCSDAKAAICLDRSVLLEFRTCPGETVDIPEVLPVSVDSVALSVSSFDANLKDVNAQDDVIALPDGKVVSTSEAVAHRESIIAKEHERLAMIKDQIAVYVRQSDGSDQAKAQIAAMTSAMLSARSG